MEDKSKAIRELHEKIEELAKKQKSFQQEISQLQNEIFQLDLSERGIVKKQVTITAKPVPAPAPVAAVRPSPAPVHVQPAAAAVKIKKAKTPIEEFIGTNLLNKIGIAILVIGIGFGVKYSIDHQLMQPLTRIILGYISGIGLIGLALKLKKNHINFSAVLLSGGMAVMYFITYAAYDFYDLIPQTMAFILMVVFTAFTVFAAMQYNIEVVGIIGLVGAYAVPFLLSDGSGRVLILFSYVQIINMGILILSFKKYWKRLYYLAFTLTWLTFAVWWFDQFDVKVHLVTSLVFSTIYFITFYITFLSYKLIRKEPLAKIDLAFMLINSFVFYGFGYASIEQATGGEELLGLFTLATAVLHFIACVVIFRKQSHFKDVFYFVAGMVLVFLTLAVPVQLEGNWVTLVWAMEALLLFWIGRTKQFAVYEKLSYPLVALAVASLVHDWGEFYITETWYAPEQIIHIDLFLNIQFLTTVLVCVCLALLLFVSIRHKSLSPYNDTVINNLISYSIGLTTIILLYSGIFAEIQNYWNQRYVENAVMTTSSYGDRYLEYDVDLLRFGSLWLIYYSALFAIAISLVQIRLFKDNFFARVGVIAVNGLVIFAFITVGLYELSYLRDSYLNDFNNPLFYRAGNIGVRYIGLVLMIPLLMLNMHLMRWERFDINVRKTESVLFHLAVLILLSSELVHWMEMSFVEESFKLGLSILWGAYALFLVILGLWKNHGYLRIAAMVLFAITLLKLFLYDMEDMSTIAKTIVMIILGVLMLIASFLYNKAKRPAENDAQ